MTGQNLRHKIDINESIRKNIVGKLLCILILIIIYFIFWQQNIAYDKGQLIIYRMFVVSLLSLIGVFLVFKSINLTEKQNFIISIAGSVIAIFYNFIMLQYSQGYSWYIISPMKIIANIILITIIFLIAYGISSSFKFAIVFLNVISVVFAVANYFVIVFRGTAILASDYYSLTTAGNVAGEYSYILNYNCYIYILLTFVLSILVVKLKKVSLFKGYMRLIPITIAVISMLVGYALFIHYDGFDKSLKIKMYKPQVSYEQYGMYLTFVHSIRYLDMKKPEGYSVENVEELNNQYNRTSTQADKNPNIIVIMNEAFTDFSEIGDLEVNEDYLPFYHSLKENTVKGDMFVSVFGGGTSNTEFEVLTSNSLAFTPEGSSPFVTYINNRMPSMATTLSEQNYGGMIAIHPYKGNGYKRNKVYPLLGFDEFLTRDDFHDYREVRNFISDESSFDRIISEYEEYKESNDTPFFLFNVTMQNHSAYDKYNKNFTKQIKTKKKYGKDVNVYLNLIKETDNALQKLITYFENQEEPTVVVMFGDHQPRIYNTEFYKDITDTFKLDDVYKNFNKFNTQFMIWANYDIDEREHVTTSANYINSLISETTGIKMSGFQNMVSQIRKDIPVITQKGYVGADGNYYTLDDKSSPYYRQIEKYRYAVYNNVFDSENRVEKFFTLDLTE